MFNNVLWGYVSAKIKNPSQQTFFCTWFNKILSYRCQENLYFRFLAKEFFMGTTVILRLKKKLKKTALVNRLETLILKFKLNRLNSLSCRSDDKQRDGRNRRTHLFRLFYHHNVMWDQNLEFEFCTNTI